MSSTDAFAEAETFRAEVRRFCAEKLPADLRRKVLDNLWLEKADYVRWMRLLHERGWSAGHWPKRHGGCDWSPLQRYVFEEETSIAGAPWLIPFGIGMVGPVIYTFGDEAQKRRFLPPILDTSEWWAQGYSEPGSGSDLASLRTRAVRDGDHWVVTGQKLWTSYAQWADWMFCLVRTNDAARPQDGISFLLIDMRSPGITVRPVVTMDMGHHVNEVFLDGVRVPAANLVGQEGGGWTYAKFLLGNERVLVAEAGRSTRQLARLKDFAGRTLRRGRPLAEDPAFARRLAELEHRLFVLQSTCALAVSESMGGAAPGAEASLMKIRGTELQQDIAEAMVDALGLAGLVYDPRALTGDGVPPEGPPEATGMVREHLHIRAASIYGGSNEIQRNIIAKAVLGL